MQLLGANPLPGRCLVGATPAGPPGAARSRETLKHKAGLWTAARNTAGRGEKGQGREVLGRNAEFRLDVQGHWSECAGLIPSAGAGGHPLGCSGNVARGAVCWGMAAEPEAVAATKNMLTHSDCSPWTHSRHQPPNFSAHPPLRPISPCSPIPQQPCLQTYAPKSFPSLPKYTPSPKPASRLTGRIP